MVIKNHNTSKEEASDGEGVATYIQLSYCLLNMYN